MIIAREATVHLFVNRIIVEIPFARTAVVLVCVPEAEATNRELHVVTLRLGRDDDWVFQLTVYAERVLV